MRLFSSDGSPAVVGVGQQANGIIAVGQFARGFIAIGQVSVGVVAIGQACFSVVGLGQAGGGVTWFAGMVGVGGRGFCLRLIPGLDPPRRPPETVPFGQLAAGAPGADGFVRVDLVRGPSGAVGLAVDGQLLPVKPTPTVAWALDNAQRNARVRSVLAHVRRAGATLVCDRVIEIPRTRRSYSVTFQAVRVALLVGLATLWWYAFAWVPWTG